MNLWKAKLVSQETLTKVSQEFFTRSYKTESSSIISMNKTSKSFTIFLILILAASSLIIVKTAGAQITQVSVPEFTLQYVEVPIDVPPMTTIDPYTGKSVNISPEYHGETRNVDITIKNQPFNPYTDANGNSVCLFYNVSLKGYYENLWQRYPPSGYGNNFFAASTSDTTVIRVSLGYYPEIPSGGQLDILVEAVLGTQSSTGFSIVAISGLTTPQTVTVGYNTPTEPATASPIQSPSISATPGLQNPTPVPQQPSTQSNIIFGLTYEQIGIAGLCILVIVLAAALVFTHRKRTK